jgi:hypothetical protein
MAALAVGPAAIDRASATTSGNTVLDLANPCNGSGVIDTLTLYVASNTTTTKMGIFFLVSGTTYQCRSAYSAGAQTTGLKTFSSLSLRVQKGDFIGMYHSGGTIDRADSGGTSAYYVGDVCTVGASQSFTTASQARIVSMHGAGLGWIAISKVCGVTAVNLAKVTNVNLVQISKIYGVSA